MIGRNKVRNKEALFPSDLPSDKKPAQQRACIVWFAWSTVWTPTKPNANAKWPCEHFLSTSLVSYKRCRYCLERTNRKINVCVCYWLWSFLALWDQFHSVFLSVWPDFKLSLSASNWQLRVRFRRDGGEKPRVRTKLCLCRPMNTPVSPAWLT